MQVRSTQPHFIAVDLGAESGRVVSATIDGAGVHVNELARFANEPVLSDGAMVWDIHRLYTSILEGLRRAPAARSIGIDGWGVDFALLCADGSLAAPPRCYRDPLTSGILPRLFTRVPRDELFRTTGIQMMEINTLCQLLALRHAGAPELDRAERLLMIPDLLLHWLGAEPGAERTNASTTQMLTVDGTWSEWLADAVGAPLSLLPPIVEPGAIRGVATGVSGTSLNGADIQLVSVASHDTAAAVVAAPLSGDGCAFISSGTWSLVGIEVAQPVLGDAALRHNLSNEWGYGNKFRLLRNVMGLWLLQQCRRCFADADGAPMPYDAMVQMAAAAPSFTAVIDPDSPQFLRADDLPSHVAASCVAAGQPAPADRGTLVRVILESLALRYRWTLEALTAASGRQIDSVSVIGGGSRNGLLCQLTADATGLPLSAGPVEASAVGNVIVQAISAGALSGVAAGRELVRASGELTWFEPRADSRWDEAYARFCALPGVGPPSGQPSNRSASTSAR